MIRLGESARRQLGPWAALHLARLVTKYGETANMAMLEGDACVYIAQVPSPQSMRMFTEVGRVVMLHSTGVGKAILSTLPDAQVMAILQRAGMPARTDQTITSPDQMLTTLRQIRQNGYAVDEGEQELGVRCVAVPITGLTQFSQGYSKALQQTLFQMAEAVIDAHDEIDEIKFSCPTSTTSCPICRSAGWTTPARCSTPPTGRTV